MSQRLHTRAACVLATFLFLCHDSVFFKRGLGVCVCVHAGTLPERAPGTNISKLHAVNILKNRNISLATFTFLCLIVEISIG